MKIDLFLNQKSCFDVLQTFTHEFHQALQQAKIDSKILDVGDKKLTIDWLEEYVKTKKPDFLGGFNTVCFAAPLVEKTNFISIIVDPICFYPELFCLNEQVVCHVDKDCCQLLKSWGHQRTLFLPHAVSKEVLEKKVKGERKYDIVFPASFIDPDAILKEWKKTFSPRLYNFLGEIIDRSLMEREFTHMTLFLHALRDAPDIKEEFDRKRIEPFNLMCALDDVIRGKDKIGIIQGLSDFDVHVFGSKKDQAVWKKESKGNLIFHDPVPYKDLWKLFSESKIVINSVPRFKQSLHERLLLALSQGASVITNSNIYCEAEFPQSRAVSYFTPPRWGLIANLAQELLQDEGKRISDVEKARHHIAKHHTWDVRVKELVQGLKSLNL